MFLKPHFAAAALAALALTAAAPASAGTVDDIVHDLMGPKVVGSGVIKTQVRKLDGFDVIESKGSIDLDIKLGSEYSVVVEADDNLFDVIRTEVRGSALVVDTKGSWTSRHDTVVHVTLPRLMALGLQGSGDVRIHDYSGDQLGVKIQGSGDIVANGRTAKLHLVIQGSGDADFSKLSADEVKVRVDGSGDAKVNAAQSIEATIHGSGDVTWSGGASKVDSQVYGSGELIHR
ncbi:MAG TPA: head GIN domain-containing protein [Nevskia sp.]|nr:head GIN domain-containing protein [Nevskia sp.]